MAQRAIVLGTRVRAGGCGSGGGPRREQRGNGLRQRLHCKNSPVQVADNPLAASAACAPLVAKSTAAGSKNYPDAEVEPYVASDPSNPSHLVASFQQDRWNDGGADGCINVVSQDGGRTWTLAATQPTFSICEGAAPGSAGYLDRATDPWTSFSSDGKIVYSISDSFNANGPAFGGASSIIISRSTDGGVNWQAPVTAIYTASNTALNDKESVTADSLNPNVAYAVWDPLVAEVITPTPGVQSLPWFAVRRSSPRRCGWRRDVEPRPGHLRSGREGPDDRQPDRGAVGRSGKGSADRRL